ncbi:hypothetical protein F2P81_003477 [Scophthalmus maximus]|uniref:Uncharacterized protein n=1 Tax=Scophthalmus maximus TaxID=52904 RepID=A0A6A4THK3_SCOMX|nr:hypothetical protein F2P81_003477 [Scophthalmus maximus]
MSSSVAHSVYWCGSHTPNCKLLLLSVPAGCLRVYAPLALSAPFLYGCLELRCTALSVTEVFVFIHQYSLCEWMYHWSVAIDPVLNLIVIFLFSSESAQIQMKVNGRRTGDNTMKRTGKVDVDD